MSNADLKLKRKMEAMRLIYRDKGIELDDDHLRYLAERHSMRDYLPQIILIAAVAAFWLWHIWH
jgi:hypothetical protein